MIYTIFVLQSEKQQSQGIKLKLLQDDLFITETGPG